jgi:formate C-acetyltransferase
MNRGFTAAIRSAVKAEHVLYPNGIAFTVGLDPVAIDGKTGSSILSALITSYCDLGGMQIQFNLVDTQTLRAVLSNPDQHRDLLVRVAGYSARFVDLA